MANLVAERAARSGETAGRILDVAERLLQERGFNAFSYADVAKELGITTAALHYHYAGKAELGEALILRYAERFAQTLERIGASEDKALAQLASYVELYAALLEGGRMCLCGMLAAEFQTLSEAMRTRVTEFLEMNETWLMKLIGRGRSEGSMNVLGSAREIARTIVATLEGAMLVARPFGDARRFRSVARHLLTELQS